MYLLLLLLLGSFDGHFSGDVPTAAGWTHWQFWSAHHQRFAGANNNCYICNNPNYCLKWINPVFFASLWYNPRSSLVFPPSADSVCYSEGYVGWAHLRSFRQLRWLPRCTTASLFPSQTALIFYYLSGSLPHLFSYQLKSKKMIRIREVRRGCDQPNFCAVPGALVCGSHVLELLERVDPRLCWKVRNWVRAESEC